MAAFIFGQVVLVAYLILGGWVAVRADKRHLFLQPKFGTTVVGYTLLTMLNGGVRIFHQLGYPLHFIPDKSMALLTQGIVLCSVALFWMVAVDFYQEKVTPPLKPFC